MVASEIFKTFFSNVTHGDWRKAWSALNEVPDCPQCRGDGLPHEWFSEWVYWQGQKYEVCATCKGAGKV